MPQSKKVKDIWGISLGPTTGHEQFGIRPAIIIAVSNRTKLATIIPLTGNIDASRFPYTLLIKRSPTNGLSTDSIVMIFQLRSLSYERFVNKKGSIDSKNYDTIKLLLKKYLNL